MADEEIINDTDNQVEIPSPETDDKENHPNTIEYKKIVAEREEYKELIRKNMEKLNFTEEEKQKIFDIIEYHYILMETAKIPLAQVGPNDVLDEVESDVKKAIKQISGHMLFVLRENFQKIMAGKNSK